MFDLSSLSLVFFDGDYRIGSAKFVERDGQWEFTFYWNRNPHPQFKVRAFATAHFYLQLMMLGVDEDIEPDRDRPF